MSKLTVTVTFTIFFSLFILSKARVQLTQPSNLITEYKPSESDHHLPSEKSEYETLTIDDIPVSDPNTNPDTIRAIGVAQPLVMTFDLRFRPVNHHVHHMHLTHPFLLRFPHHRCGHHSKHAARPREISYGNDMIVGENSGHVARLSEVSYGDDMIVGDNKGLGQMDDRVNEVRLTENDLEKKDEGFMKKVRKFLGHF